MKKFLLIATAVIVGLVILVILFQIFIRGFTPNYAVDNVLTGFLLAIWELIEIPAIFIALSILIVYLVGRDFWHKYIYAIREIKAGSVSVFTDIERLIEKQEVSFEKEDNQPLIELPVEYLRPIVGEFRVNLSKFFSKVANKPYSVLELLDFMEKEEVLAQNEDRVEGDNFADVGYFIALWHLDGYFYDLELKMINTPL